MKFASPHKYIKNTSTNGRTLTEHMLNSSGRPQTPKRTRIIPMQSGMVKERIKEETGSDQHPWQGAEGEERFSYSEKPPHGR